MTLGSGSWGSVGRLGGGAATAGAGAGAGPGYWMVKVRELGPAATGSGAARATAGAASGAGAKMVAATRDQLQLGGSQS